MACRTYTPGSIPTHALRNDFFLKTLRDIHFDENLLSRISSKCSVEAIKNTTFYILRWPKGLGRWDLMLTALLCNTFQDGAGFPKKTGCSLCSSCSSSHHPPGALFFPLPSLPTAKRGLWGEESEVSIVLLITISEYPLQISWLYLTRHDKQQLYTVPSSQTGQ